MADKLEPIDTAPKDGSYFLFVGKQFDGGMAVVHWSADLEWWMLDDGKNFEIAMRAESGLTGWLSLPNVDEIARLKEQLEAATNALAEAVVIIVKWSPGGMAELQKLLGVQPCR